MDGYVLSDDDVVSLKKDECLLESSTFRVGDLKDTDNDIDFDTAEKLIRDGATAKVLMAGSDKRWLAGKLHFRLVFTPTDSPKADD